MVWRLRNICGAWLVGASLLAGSAMAQSTRLYVDADAAGTGNGTSWTNAYNKLQDGLSYAGSHSSVKEIWVAAGTYKPAVCSTSCGSGSSERSATFLLVNGVGVYGGFAGTETSLGQRSFGCVGGDNDGDLCAVSSDCPGGACANPTRLSGDLNGDDGANWANYAENSYHVVTYNDPAATKVALDGFTIEAGNADAANGPENQGGGMHIRNGTAKCLAGGPTIKNCLIQNNSATHHGAVNDHGLATSIRDSWFRNNRTVGDAGGHGEGAGLQIHMGSTLTEVVGCRFTGNISATEGGGIWLGCNEGEDVSCGTTSETCANDATRPRPRIVGCAFEGNSADTGGGIFAGRSNATFDGCTFDGNDAVGGGGAWTDDNSATFSSCEFCDNTAGATGGGALYQNGGTAAIDACTFDDNVSQHGGGIYFINSTGRVANSQFTANYATSTYGGGIYVDTSDVAVVGCFFEDNWGSFAAGATYAGSGSTFVVANSAFTGNSAGGFGGGAFAADGGTHVFLNSTFWQNASNALGLFGEQTTITNCTFFGNLGFGIYHDSSRNDTIVENSILWGNTFGQIDPSCDPPAEGLTVSYSTVEGGYCGTGNDDADPDFVDAPEDLHLSVGSDCIDSGDNAALTGGSCSTDDDCTDPVESCVSGSCVVTADGGGCVRKVNNTVDRGAFEYNAAVENDFDPDTFLTGPCTDDGDCLNTAVCIQGNCYAPKNRYVTFGPGNQSIALAFKITIAHSSLFPSAVGIEKWVGVPDAAGIARLVCNCPPYKTNWPATLQVSDVDVVPGTMYDVRSIQIGLDTTNPNNYSAPVRYPTSSVWGDVVGTKVTLSCSPTDTYWTPPDGVVTDDDVNGCVARFQGLPTAPPLSWVDVDPQVPNKLASFADVGVIVSAKAGYAYPFAAPTACADAGPCGACCTLKFGVWTCLQKTQTACGAGTWTQGAQCSPLQCGLIGGGGQE